MSTRTDIRRGRWVVAALLALASSPLACASPDATGAEVPPLKLGVPAPRSDFYFKVDSGAVFFEPPKKDNSNFQDAAFGGPTTGASSLGTQDGNDTTWSAGGTIGWYLPRQPEDSWMGKNLRVEASGNYLSTSNTQTSSLSVSPGGLFLIVGRLDGNYTGTHISTDIGSLSVGPNPVAHDSLTTEDELYSAGAALRSDYIFFNGRVVLSPKLGFEWSHLDQDFHTTASGAKGSIDQHETLDTDYFGPKFDLELKVQLARNFVGFAEGELSPLYATSDYSGNQSGTSLNGGGAGQDSANDSKDQFTFKGGVTGGFYYDFGPVILKLGGGFEYWNYVATVQEARVPAGSNTFTAPPFTVGPSHLGSSDMLNPTAQLSVIVPF